MRLFSKKNKAQYAAVQTAQSGSYSAHPFTALSRQSAFAEREMYKALREAVPIIDAAISKIVRLTGEFELTSVSPRCEKALKDFSENVRVGGTSTGLQSFVWSYLEDLLTFGEAVGEMIPLSNLRGVYALYNAPLEDIELKEGESPLDVKVCKKGVGESVELPFQEFMTVSLLSPSAGTLQGTPILRGLPFASSILLKIFGSIGKNFDRIGNIRYAVTYKPPEGGVINPEERARVIANEWSKAMRDPKGVYDFVCVGDVGIKVIGADNQELECDVPLKHILEQIVSKLSIPPFLLGLSWSSTERMSSVQADILTSELEYFRSILTPVIKKICSMHLRLMGITSPFEVKWNNISLMDEVELAKARKINAEAKSLEQKLEAKI
ncbi:MAG: serine/threonine protein phosphatase [Clostridia bacterium]|nr:serine/threonine protein phosphatase [Clostridia bacterium]